MTNTNDGWTVVATYRTWDGMGNGFTMRVFQNGEVVINNDVGVQVSPANFSRIAGYEDGRKAIIAAANKGLDALNDATRMAYDRWTAR